MVSDDVVKDEACLPKSNLFTQFSLRSLKLALFIRSSGHSIAYRFSFQFEKFVLIAITDSSVIVLPYLSMISYPWNATCIKDTHKVKQNERQDTETEHRVKGLHWSYHSLGTLHSFECIWRLKVQSCTYSNVAVLMLASLLYHSAPFWMIELNGVDSCSMLMNGINKTGYIS